MAPFKWLECPATMVSRSTVVTGRSGSKLSEFKQAETRSLGWVLMTRLKTKKSGHLETKIVSRKRENGSWDQWSKIPKQVTWHSTMVTIRCAQTGRSIY